MSVITDFWKFIRGKTLGGKTYKVSSKDIEEFISDKRWDELALYEFALQESILSPMHCQPVRSEHLVSGKKCRKNSITDGIMRQMIT